jgi:hypothetical protein
VERSANNTQDWWKDDGNIRSSDVPFKEVASLVNSEVNGQNQESEEVIVKTTSSNDEFDVVATEPPATVDETQNEEAKKDELVHELVEAIAAEIKEEEESSEPIINPLESTEEREPQKQLENSESAPVHMVPAVTGDTEVVETTTVSAKQAVVSDTAAEEAEKTWVENHLGEQPIAKDTSSTDEFDVVATEPQVPEEGAVTEEEEKKEELVHELGEVAEVAIEPSIAKDASDNDEIDVAATEPPVTVNGTKKENEATKEELVHELVEEIAAEIQKEEEFQEPVAEVTEVKETVIIAEKEGVDIETNTAGAVENAEADNDAEKQPTQDETAPEQEKEKKETWVPTESIPQPAANYEDDEFDVVGEAPPEVTHKENNNGAVEENQDVLPSLELPACSPLTVQDGQQDGQSVTYFDSPVDHSSFRREDSLISRSRLASEGSMMSEFLSEGSSSFVVNNDEFLPLLREHPLTALATTIKNIQLQLPEGKEAGSVLMQRNLFLVFKIGKKIKFYTRR